MASIKGVQTTVRILFATDWWPPRVGGIECQVFDLARARPARQHDVRVLATTRERGVQI
jgi:hypothetical protein